MSQAFKEGSSAREAFHKVEMALAVAEMAMQAKQLASSIANTAQQIALAGKKAVHYAVSGIARAADLPFPLSVAAVATMTALMVKVLSMAGLSLSGGGGGGSSTVASQHISSGTNVLGGEAGTFEDSAKKSLEILEGIYNVEYTGLKKLNDSILSLNSIMSETFSGVTSEYGTFSTTQMDLGSLVIDQIMKSFEEATKNNPLMGKFGEFLINMFSGYTENFVNKTAKEVGISFGNATIEQILSGVKIGAEEYAITTTGEEYTIALSDQISNDIAMVYKEISNTIVSLAEILGTNITDAMNYVFTGFNLDLQNLSSEDAITKINEYFNRLSDKAVEALFGDLLGQYRLIGETWTETATRIASDLVVVMDTLDMTRQHFVGTNVDMIAFSEHLIELAGGLDELRDVADSYFDAFFSDAEKNERYHELLTESLSEMNMQLPTARSGYRALVEGLDLQTKSGQEAYVTLLQLSEMADDYYSHLEDLESDRMDMTIRILQLEGKETEALALERRLELDAMDESLKALQEMIWALEDSAKAAEELAEEQARLADIAIQQRSLDIRLMELMGDEIGALAASRADELAAMDESLRSTQLLIWQYEDEAEAAEELAKEQEDQLEAQQKLIDGIRNLIETIDDWLASLSTSANLAPGGTSAVAWTNEYNRLLNLASGGGEEQVKNYLSYAKDYLSFMKSFGGDYQELYNMVVGDVLGIRSTLQGQLPAMYVGGLTDGPTLTGEKGREWVVPTYEPHRSSFLRDVGVDSEKIGKTIAHYILSESGGESDRPIHVHVHIDEREVGTAVINQAKSGRYDLIKTLKRVVA
jgi:hypothetical protein